MSDRTCPKCKSVFKYPSLLKIHMKNAFHCITSDANIEKHINSIKLDKTNICVNCEKSFTRNSDLTRHKINSKCGKLTVAQHTETTYGLNKLTIEQLKLLYPNNYNNILNNIQTQITNTAHNNTANTANTSNTVNTANTVNNNIMITNNTINNNTIIQHINPFGFEDIRAISIKEMKKILNSGTDAGIHIVKAIYNKIENKNFYKPNISRSEVACLNNEFNLTIYKSREFCDSLFDKCISLLHHMLYLCKNEFTKHNIKCIYNNIEYIENTMRIEIYDKKLQNIIESEFRNNNIDTKDRIKNFIKKIKEESDIKDNSLLMIKNNIDLKDEKNEEYKTSIKNEELNKLFGDPKVILGLKKEELLLNLRITRFEESIFYNFWKERLRNIQNYIMTNKNSTIGDIINITKEETKINTMLDIIKLRVDNIRGDDYLSLNINEEFKLEDYTLQDTYTANTVTSPIVDTTSLNTFANLV